MRGAILAVERLSGAPFISCLPISLRSVPGASFTPFRLAVSAMLLFSIRARIARRLALVFLCALACACSNTACGSSDPARPDSAYAADYVYRIGFADLKALGRSFAVDSVWFLPDDPALGRTFFYELSRAQSGPSFQAEERAFFYTAARGFAAAPAAGVYENRERVIETPPRSPLYRAAGDPGAGGLLELAAGGLALRYLPLTRVVRIERGLARRSVWVGTGELTADFQTASGRVVIERLYLPVANPFAPGENRLFAAQTRAWLSLPGAYLATLTRGGNAWVAPLFEGERARAALVRTAPGQATAAYALAGELERGASDPDSSAPSGVAWFQGAFALEEQRCAWRFRATHSREFFSLSGGASQFYVGAGSVECPERVYALQAWVRDWPVADAP